VKVIKLELGSERQRAKVMTPKASTAKGKVIKKQNGKEASALSPKN
jgi:hypothetical protein